MQLAIRFLKKSHLSDLHHPITDIQANFGINRPIRYQITVKKKVFTHTDGRTDGQTACTTIGIFFNWKD